MLVCVAALWTSLLAPEVTAAAEPEALTREVSVLVAFGDANPEREVLSREIALLVGGGVAAPESEVLSREVSLLVEGGVGEPESETLSREVSLLVEGGWVGEEREVITREVSLLIETGDSDEWSEIITREVSLLMELGSPNPEAEVISREVGVVVADPILPAVIPPGTILTARTSTTAYGAVDLDWSGYDEAGQTDIVRYRVYRESAYFDDVTPRVPVAFMPVGTRKATVTGLTGLANYHFAVVAEEAGGGFNPAVQSIPAIASVSGVGEVLNLAVESGVDRLRFTWDAPAETGGFLAGFRVDLGEGTVPVDLPPSARSWDATGLTAATGYPFRIRTLDTFGNESPGRSLLAATWLVHPGGVALNAQGEDVVLSWDASLPASLVKEYAVFRDAAPISDVSTLTPIAKTTARAVTIGTIASVAGSHFAVAVVNISDGLNPSVTSVSATRERQTLDFPLPVLGGPIVALTATASSGLPVTFAATPASIAVLEGTNLRVLQGGPMTVRALQAGNAQFWGVEATQEIRIPPVIRSFAANGTELTDGQRLTAVTVTLSVAVDDVIGLARAEFYGRPMGGSTWTLLGWDEVGTDGWTLTLGLLPLPRGTYQTRVVVMTQDGAEAERVRTVDLDPIPLPDLTVLEMDLPGSVGAGQLMSVGWTTTNAGLGNVTAGWTTRVLLSRNPAGTDGLPRSVVSTNRPLASGEVLSQTTTFLTPGDWSGQAYLVLELDPEGTVSESNEANNLASIPITLTLPPSPDLVVSDVIAPAEAAPGAPVEIRWRVTNSGTVAASGPWRESLSISNALQGLRELVLVTVEAGLAPGASVERSQTLLLPAGTAAGASRFWVSVDARDEVLEANEGNNRAASDPPTSVPHLLTFTLSTDRIREDAVNRTVRVTVTRNGATTAPLTVGVSGLDASEVLGASELQIPAGQSSATLDWTVVSDGVVDGDQTLTLRAEASGYPGAVASLTVLDADRYRLFLTLDPLEILEGGLITGTVRREHITDQPLTVSITSSQENQLSPTPVVVIAAGAASATFDALAVDDAAAEGPLDYTLTVSATGHHDGTATVRILDNDLPNVVLTLANRTVSEGDGPYALSATVTRAPVGSGDLAIELVNPDPGLMLMPTRVVIPGGRASRSFPMGVLNDGLVNGARTVAIGGYVLAVGTGARLAAVAPDTLTVTDDDGPTLKLVADRTLVKEGENPATWLTVTRNTPPTEPLEVTLTSNDPGEATVPLNVVIPAGSVSASFDLTSVADGQPDGNQSVEVSASAPGFIEGRVTVVVSDTDLPDLIVKSVVVPAGAAPRQRVEVRYRLANQGLSAAAQSVLTRVSLSRDPVMGDDLLVAQSRSTETLAVGATVERTESVELPVEVGSYWVVVETDAEQALDEVLENNNAVISSQPIVVTADYEAWVRKDGPDARLAGETVTLRGQTVALGGNPVGPRPVTVHVWVRGTVRRITATSDASGNFTAVFTPLPGEAGRYEVYATHPGVARVSVQDTFALLGFRPVPASQSLTMIEGTSRSVNVSLQNLADIALEGVSVEVVSKPSNLEVTFGVGASGDAAKESPRRSFRLAAPTLARSPGSGDEAGGDPWRLASLEEDDGMRYVGTGQATGLHRVKPRLQGEGPTLPSLGSLNLNVTLRAPVADSFGTVHLKVRTAEGLAQDVYLGVSVEPLRPRLVAVPGTLSETMVVGGQRIVEFDVVNLGGRESGPIDVLLPAVPWMTVATPQPMASLEPGASNRVALVLLPPADLPLGAYNGSLAVNGAATGISVPFAFRAISEAKGDLRIEAVTEFTYYAEGAPRLAGASVTVRDSVSQVTVATGTTGEDGFWTAAGLYEGHYDIEVRADKHSTFRRTILLKGGTTNDVLAFLSRQVVSYTWTVEPVEFEDRYKIVVESTFETVVPVPVITVEPSVIDLAEITDDEVTIPIKITNHGLIAANEMVLHLPSHSDWEFSAVITDIGVLGARTEIQVPLRIVRSSTRSVSSVALHGIGSVDCHIGAPLTWAIICGKESIRYAHPIDYTNARTTCKGRDLWGMGWRPEVPGGVGPPGGWGSYFPPTGVQSPVPPSVNPCDGLCIFTAAAGCVPGVGCGPAAVDCGMGGAGGFSIQVGMECALGFAGCIPVPGLSIPSCVYSIVSCIKKLNDQRRNLGSGALMFNQATGDRVQEQHGRSQHGIRASDPYYSAIEAYIDVMTLLLGPVTEVWLARGGEPDLAEWWAKLATLTGEVSEGGQRIAEGEMLQLMTAPLPGGMAAEMVEAVLLRWNRSIDYWSAGIRSVSDVPSGQNSDFIEWTPLELAYTSFAAGHRLAVRSGYRDVFDAVVTITREQAELGEAGGVCARVKIRLEQEAVIARDGFRATLELVNDGLARLENVGVDVVIRSEDGQVVNELFGVRFEEATVLSAVDGNGILPGNSTGTAKWLLIPSVDSAPTGPTQYRVGGTLKYRLEGNDVEIAFAEVPITVLPIPRLALKYFHQRDVYSDDPFTDVLEPSVPYNLALMVDNRGMGTARNFRITSAQPKIVENEKGLLIDFQIVASEVSGKAVSPSLTLGLGDIGPGQRRVGRWLLTSSLQGLFIDYSATFEHLDGLGNPRLSILEDVSIHEMIRLVRADRDFEDGLPDFLVNEIPDARDLPDTLYLSDGSTNDVRLVQVATPDRIPTADNLEVTLTALMPGGWAYLRVPDPADGRLYLARVLRPDGTDVGAGTNAWVTDRTFIGLGRRPIRENVLHLLDHDSPGQYTLVYAEVPSGPVDDVAPTSQVEPLPESVTPWFPVRWSGRDQGRLGEAASGVAWYDLYVSENDGPFVPWLRKTPLVGSTFIGRENTRYAFYSVATDGAGNVEETPALPDAVTSVGRVNARPVLMVPSTITVDEGAVANFVATASDADGETQTLTFSLGTERPAGAIVDATTGRVSWSTGEADGGTTRGIEVVVTDNGFPSLSATGRVSVVVREVNTPPLAVGDRISRQAGKRIRFRESQLLANDLDVDGDRLTLTGVAGTSALGGVVRRAEGWVTYIPPLGNDGDDWFTYTVSDGEYDATGMVEVVVGAATEDTTLNIVGTAVGADGSVRLSLVGIPGREYRIQMANRLTNPVWTTVGTARADAVGRFEFLHANPPSGSAFYRAVERTGPVAQ